MKRRLSILKDVAHGMAYLHHHCSPAIVHGDLKPSNVLLDETMTAHVGDFGISCLMTSAARHDNSTAALTDTSSLVIGSIGYTAPEYGIGGRLSLKGDVYSFGILVLETITGKRPTDPLFSEEGQSGSTLHSCVGDAFPDRLMEVIDGNLVEEIRKEEEDRIEVKQESHHLNEMGNAIKGRGIAVWLAEIGMLCTKEAPQDRPTLTEVETSLERLVAKIHEGF